MCAMHKASSYWKQVQVVDRGTRLPLDTSGRYLLQTSKTFTGQPPLKNFLLTRTTPELFDRDHYGLRNCNRLVATPHPCPLGTVYRNNPGGASYGILPQDKD